jgi:tRNA nucleotidyltransferase/poly(A) polymerase
MADGRTARRLDAAWLSDGALARLLSVLDRDGEEARIVGGAVRNALLDEPIAEVDVATTALPDEVTRRVGAAGFKAVPTGIEHGTVTVVIGGDPFEVTSLRQDVETYGRHAKVAFGRSWKTDAERRDFTMNALSATRDGTVYDYVGGLDDLARRHVRFIGQAKQRIEEDYLRILRFFRFHAAYGRGVLDAGGLHACIAARGGLVQLSRERVRMELIKLLIAPGAAPVVEAMADAGLLQLLIGGVPNGAHFSALTKIETTLSLPPDAMRRLAALTVLVAEDAERLWQKLRLSNDEQARLTAMANGWPRLDPTMSEQSRHASLYSLGGFFGDVALLAWARSGASVTDVSWRGLASLPQRWHTPVFPLKAAGFIARGLAKGPALGAALRAAEQAWIAADFPSDPAVLSAIADDAARVKG